MKILYLKKISGFKFIEKRNERMDLYLFILID